MIAAAIALVPWLALLPLHGVLGLLANVVALVAAFHGWGRVVTRRAPAMLAIWVGLATVIALAGVAMLVHAYTLAGQVAIVFAGVACHGVIVVLERDAIATRARELRADARAWLPPVILLAIVGVLVVAGAAGDVGARPFDDDGHVLGQLRALADTGALGDAIGYPRRMQLGGQLGFLALANVLGDGHVVRALDALACVLVLALGFARLQLRQTAGAIWAMLLVVVALALPFAVDDLAPAWLVVGLVVAIVVALEARLPAHAIGILVGAFVAVRLELAPLAIAGLVVAGLRAPSARRWREIATLAIVTLAVLGPFVIARAIAWSEVPAAARPWIVTGAWSSYALRFAWPLAIALGLVLVLRVARGTHAAVTVITLLALGLAIQVGHSAGGRKRWLRRGLEVVAGVTYVHEADAAVSTTAYERALVDVPADARVAVWVDHPELIDHAAHAIIDLRTPRIRERGRILTALAAVRGRGRLFLLVEDNDRLAADRPQLYSGGGLKVVEVVRGD